MDCTKCAKLQRELTELKEELAIWRAGPKLAETDPIMPTLQKVSRALRATHEHWPGFTYPSIPVAMLLQAFLAKPGHMYSRERLFALCRGPNASGGDDVNTRVVDVMMSRLRKALRALGHANPIVCVWGQGYYMQTSAAAELQAWWDNIAAQEEGPTQ